MTTCLLLTVRNDALSIARLIEGLGVKVVRKCTTIGTFHEFRTNPYDGVIVEATLPRQFGTNFIRTLEDSWEGDVFPKFFLLCDPDEAPPHAWLKTRGIFCLPRPFSELKMRALLRTAHLI